MNKILQIRPKIRPEKLGGKKLTLPGLYVKPYEALQQYSDKSPEMKAAQYYSDEGLDIPDFEKMDKIERLEALSEYRGKVLEIQAQLKERNSEAQKKAIQEEIDKQIENKVNERLQQTTANTGVNSGKA